MRNIAIVSAVLLLFGFKYPLDGFLGTGVRLDDIVLFSVVLLLFIARDGVVDFPRFIWPLCVVLFCALVSMVISSLYGTGLNYFQAILFTLRHVEYFLIFSIGRVIPVDSFYQLLRYFVIYQLIIVLFQKIGYLGFGTTYNIVERQVGSTGGPWELAVIASLPFFLFWERREYLYMAVSGYLIWATGSRITITSTAIVSLVLILVVVISGNSRRALTAGFGLLLVSVAVLILVSTGVSEGVFFERLASVLDFDFGGLSLIEVGEITPEQFALYDSKYIKGDLSSLGYEASAVSRFSRWMLALSTYINYPIIFQIFGLGPSFFGDALDGSFLRLLVTTGLVGLSAYLIYVIIVLHFFYRCSRYFLAFIVVFFFSAILIDVIYAMKANVMYWLFFGVIYSSERYKRNDSVTL
ncbi:MAG: hypothetical protein ACJAYN_002256 [Bermanella sp.]|jgi:hypothetical protein